MTVLDADQWFYRPSTEAVITERSVVRIGFGSFCRCAVRQWPITSRVKPSFWNHVTTDEVANGTDIQEFTSDFVSHPSA